MILKKHKYFELKIIKSGEFKLKPFTECVLHDYSTVENSKGFKFVYTTPFYIPMSIRLFWFKLILVLTLKPKRLSSGQRYVEYEKTHFDLMDLPQGKWNEKTKS